MELDWPQTHNLPASASQVLGLQVCTTIPRYIETVSRQGLRGYLLGAG
jgi:hypothetical protein